MDEAGLEQAHATERHLLYVCMWLVAGLGIIC